MNILHLRSSGGLFGAEGVILNLARESNALGNVNFIVCINHPTNPHEELVDEANRIGVRAESILCSGRIDFNTIAVIGKLLIKYDIQILHCHDYKANFFGLLASLFLGVKRVSTNHLWTSETARLRFYEFIDGWVLKFFHHVVAVSEKILHQIRRFHLSSRKLSVIHNGINLAKYNPLGLDDRNEARQKFNIKPDQVLIGTVGRLSVQKGYNYLLEAAKIVITRNPKVMFMIVGDGDQRQALEVQAKELGVTQNVIFAGIQTDMVRLYRAFDIFVMSSIAEGMPLVLLEAMAMQKPVIATDVGDISEVVKNRETGFIVPSRNAGELAQAIVTLVNDKEKAAYFAVYGRVAVEEKFSSNVMVKRYQQIYEAVLQKR